MRATLDDAERTQTYLKAARVREDMAQSIPILWRPILAAVAPHVDGLHLRSSPEGFYFKDIELADA